MKHRWSGRRGASVTVAAFFLAVGLVGIGLGREVLRGPYDADVLHVVDGDTLVVKARIWLGTAVEIKVRLQGIDAPELRGSCTAERRRAVEAGPPWLISSSRARSGFSTCSTENMRVASSPR